MGNVFILLLFSLRSKFLKWLLLVFKETGGSGLNSPSEHGSEGDLLPCAGSWAPQLPAGGPWLTLVLGDPMRTGSTTEGALDALGQEVLRHRAALLHG